MQIKKIWTFCYIPMYSSSDLDRNDISHCNEDFNFIVVALSLRLGL
jgi:hypothetical protein